MSLHLQSQLGDMTNTTADQSSLLRLNNLHY